MIVDNEIQRWHNITKKVKIETECENLRENVARRDFSEILIIKKIFENEKKLSSKR